MQYHNILRDYLREYAIPAMLEQGWAFKPAKSYGWEKAQRGPEYHVDQPLRTHILNGLYALTRVLEYLKEKGYYRIGEHDFKRTLVLYTMHDAYKDFELASTRKGNSDFGIPLAELDRLLERMHLRQFVPVKAEDIRAASVALLSQKVADISFCSPDITHLLTLVHLADAFASQQTARDCKTAENRLRELIRSEAITRRQDERTSKRTGIPVQSNDINLPLCFYYHELDDYRGLSTLLIHYATEQVLDGLSLYPILYFANGILYLGPTQMEADAEKLRERIATTLFEQMRQEVGEQSYTVAEQALNYGQGLKFSKDVYLFSSLNDLVKAVSNYQLTQKPAGFVGKVIDKRVSRRKYASVEDFYTSYGIPVRADMDEALARRWNAMYFMLMGLESIAEALIPGDTIEWLLTTFYTPSDVAAAIRQNISVLRTGGVSDYCIVIAYHWLSKVRFMPGDRTALEVEVADVQQAAARHALQALAQYDTEERRTGKALMREMDILTEIVVNKKKIERSKCQIMGNSCGYCPDCILYGFAATTGTGSQRARVLTDSGFVVRDIQQVMRNIKLNAIQDTIAGGIAGSAFASRENVLPQIFIPTVETLLDVTATEFTYALGNILKTTRYGAESNREGFLRNRVLGVYFSDVELFSNLELTQLYYDVLAEPTNGNVADYLSADQFISNWPQVEQAALAQAVGRRSKVENLEDLLDGVSALYEDEKVLSTMLKKLDQDALGYARDVKKGEAGEEDTEA